MTRLGNVITGVNGSDQKMLYASTGTRAALNIPTANNVALSFFVKTCLSGVDFLLKRRSLCCPLDFLNVSFPMESS